eukprot:3624373-Rhodomonas_salina.1
MLVLAVWRQVLTSLYGLVLKCSYWGSPKGDNERGRVAVDFLGVRHLLRNVGARVLCADRCEIKCATRTPATVCTAMLAYRT